MCAMAIISTANKKVKGVCGIEEAASDGESFISVPSRNVTMLKKLEIPARYQRTGLHYTQ